MARRRSAVDADLEALYAQVPDAGCKGLCAAACGPIGMSVREQQRLRQAGYRVPQPEQALQEVLRDPEWSCPALTAEERCGAYDARPMLCRLYGAAEGLRCEYGCEPAGGALPAAEGRRLLSLSVDVGGRP